MGAKRILYFVSYFGIDPVEVLDEKSPEVLIRFEDGQEVWELTSCLFTDKAAAEADHKEQVRRVGKMGASSTCNSMVKAPE